MNTNDLFGRKRMNLKYLLLVFALVLCGACTDNMKIRGQADKLAMTLDDYGADMRWGRYNKAYGYHVNTDGTKPEADLDRLEGFSVTSFTPGDAILNADVTEAVVPIEIKYYDEQYGMLRSLKQTQKWWFDVKSKSWFVESDFPYLK